MLSTSLKQADQVQGTCGWSGADVTPTSDALAFPGSALVLLEQLRHRRAHHAQADPDEAYDRIHRAARLGFDSDRNYHFAVCWRPSVLASSRSFNYIAGLNWMNTWAGVIIPLSPRHCCVPLQSLTAHENTW